MSTVLDILDQATMLVGMRAAGETLDSFTANDCLTVLNQLIDSWALEELMVYTLNRQVIQLVPAQQVYTLGSGGNVNVTRPVRIATVNWRDETQVPPLELPLYEMTQQEYHSLRTRELTSSQPLRWWYEPSFPLGGLFLHPIPTVARKVVCWLWQPWTGDYALYADLEFPPGYMRMLVHNLAVELGQQPSARLTPRTIQIADESKRMVESINAQIPVLALPTGLFGQRWGSATYTQGLTGGE